MSRISCSIPASPRNGSLPADVTSLMEWRCSGIAVPDRQPSSPGETEERAKAYRIVQNQKKRRDNTTTSEIWGQRLKGEKEMVGRVRVAGGLAWRGRKGKCGEKGKREWRRKVYI